MNPPEFVLTYLSKLESRGYEAYLVGGCVRDSLMNRTPSDWDICTNAAPDEIIASFPEYQVITPGLQHGTVIVLAGSGAVEITTFRTDGEYVGHRKPKQVMFASRLQDDLARRDFTVNAMAWSAKTGIVDYHCGREDLAHGVLRCVGEPVTRFTEDALRILRLFRFSAQLGFSISLEALGGAHTCAPYLQAISAERIQGELSRLLVSEHTEKAMRLMADTGVLSAVMPEFSACIGMEQHTPYHDRTVDSHIFAAVQAAAPSLPVRLALLLHDIGKPACFYQDEEGVGHFKGHAEKSADLAEGILARLRFENKLQQRVSALVSLHHLQLIPEQVFVRKLLARYGKELVQQLLQVCIADNSAKDMEHVSNRLELLYQVDALVNDAITQSVPLTVGDLAITGDDLMMAGFAPGPAVGKVLRILLDEILERPACNTKKYLLSKAKQLRNQVEG